MTTAPLLTASCANFSEIDPPALKNAMSMPSNDSGTVSSTIYLWPPAVISAPADRLEASSLIDWTGKLRSSNFSRIFVPQLP